MLGEPKYGWTNIKIGGKDGFHGGASYLDNVPVICLNAFIGSFENGTPASIEFDAEGWSFILTATSFGAYVIVHKDKDPSILYFENTDRIKLAKELVEDIEKYMDSWILWNPSSDEEDESLEQKQTIEKKLERLKILIKEENF